MFKESHYHSTTHELLTIIRGNATLLLGGRDGVKGNSESHTTVDVSVGDLLLLPAGYAHRAVMDSDGFSMIGSYPANGRKWDSELHVICTSMPTEASNAHSVGDDAAPITLDSVLSELRKRMPGQFQGDHAVDPGDRKKRARRCTGPYRRRRFAS